MKLAINACSLAPGGGLTGLIGYLQAWREVDAPLDITLFASRPEVLDAASECRSDIKVLPFAVHSAPHTLFARQQLGLGKVLNQTGADVVMSTMYCIRGCTPPQLVHHRNLWRFLPYSRLQALRLGPARVVRDWAARAALRDAAANAFISDYLRLQAQRFVPESEPRNYTVHNGLSASVIESASLPINDWDGLPCLTAITADVPHKDNETLIRMLASLLLKHPDIPWRLHVAGGGAYASERQLAEILGVNGHVQWHGFLQTDALDALLRRSLCLVFTSVLEGFGNPPLEAMARGCPSVVCRCTAVPEVVGDAGVLIDPHDAEGFAEAVLHIFRDTTYRSKLVKCGLARIPLFNWRNSAQKMYMLFESIMK